VKLVQVVMMTLLAMVMLMMITVMLVVLSQGIADPALIADRSIVSFPRRWAPMIGGKRCKRLTLKRTTIILLMILMATTMLRTNLFVKRTDVYVQGLRDLTCGPIEWIQSDVTCNFGRHARVDLLYHGRAGVAEVLLFMLLMMKMTMKIMMVCATSTMVKMRVLLNKRERGARRVDR